VNRGWILASVIVAAAAAAAISVRACATPATSSGGLGRWEAGVNYTLVARPQSPEVPRGKIEVNEVFWYGCSHCYALDPTLENWKRSKPAYVEFVRIPIVWGPVHRQHARLFYTLVQLGRLDLHGAVFDAIHRDGNPLWAETDEEARALHRAFLMEHGVTEKAFNEAYDSFMVTTNLARAEQYKRTFEITSVPVIIVNRKYATSLSEAGGTENLVALINDLAASEKRR